MPSTPAWPEWAIALDGGTTNTRARLLRAGHVVATARRAVGVRDAVIGSGAKALAESVREAVDELRRAHPEARPAWIVAAGMLTSEVGLLSVPHVPAPAGLDELAQGIDARVLPEIDALPIRFVPGVRTPPGPGPDGWAQADVMRGEECETLGALLALRERPVTPDSGAQRSLFLWPGSHTKLVVVDPSGRIERSHTTLAGEMLDAVARHTLLSASLPREWPEALDPEPLAEGARLARREGLGRAAFLVRIAHLAARLNPAQRAAFWIGATVADDVGHLAPHLPQAPLWVGGRQPLRGLYATELKAYHVEPVEALDDHLAEAASARGALAIALRLDELQRPVNAR
jgi:2-dehydro-3-deoxygalactonokinase